MGAINSADLGRSAVGGGVAQRLLEECGRPVGGQLTDRQVQWLRSEYIRRRHSKGEEHAYRLLRKHYVDFQGRFLCDAWQPPSPQPALATISLTSVLCVLCAIQ